MQTIPEKTVNKTWRKTAAMPESEIVRMINKFQKEQPAILAFLMIAGSDVLNQAEMELQLYLGAVVWRMMRRGEPKPEQVTENRMLELAKRTEMMALYLHKESEDEIIRTAELIFKDHNQVNVLRYVTEALYEEPSEEDMDIREEKKGLIFVNLKTVIEAMDQ